MQYWDIRRQQDTAPPQLIFVLLLALSRCAQFIREVVALGQQVVNASLAFRNVIANLELAIHPHIVNRIQLHAVRIQLARIGNAAGLLHFNQAAP